MPTIYTRWEQGSNASDYVGLTAAQSFEELRKSVDNVCKGTLDRAIQAASEAAAKVIKSAVEEMAPRKTGTLAASIVIYKAKDRKSDLTGMPIRRLLIGPQKKKGFYGYFYEFGHKAFSIKAKKKKALHYDSSGKETFAKRAKVAAQPSRPWFTRAARTIEDDAFDAGVVAFLQVISQELGD